MGSRGCLWLLAMATILLGATGWSGQGGEAAVRFGGAGTRKHHHHHHHHEHHRLRAALLVLRGGEGIGFREQDEGEMMDSIPSPSSSPPPESDDDRQRLGLPDREASGMAVAMQDVDGSIDPREETEEDQEEEGGHDHKGHNVEGGGGGGGGKDAGDEVYVPNPEDEIVLSALEELEEKRKARETMRMEMHAMGVSSVPFDDDDEKTVVSCARARTHMHTQTNTLPMQNLSLVALHTSSLPAPTQSIRAALPRMQPRPERKHHI